jgi:hypothetical protein
MPTKPTKSTCLEQFHKPVEFVFHRMDVEFRAHHIRLYRFYRKLICGYLEQILPEHIARMILSYYSVPMDLCVPSRVTLEDRVNSRFIINHPNSIWGVTKLPATKPINHTYIKKEPPPVAITIEIMAPLQCLPEHLISRIHRIMEFKDVNYASICRNIRLSPGVSVEGEMISCNGPLHTLSYRAEPTQDGMVSMARKMALDLVYLYN